MGTHTHGIPFLASSTLDMYYPPKQYRWPPHSIVADLVEAMPPSLADFENGGCPNLAALRSPVVASGHFNFTMLSGLWYEQAFMDIAQAAASCQKLDFDVHDGVPVAAFSVKYGFLPVSITQVFAPTDEAGVYLKHAQIPGGMLLKIPTVVVDATADTLTLFSCRDFEGISPGISPFKELVVATRHPSPSSDVVDDKLAEAQKLGVPFERTEVSLVDQSKCPIN
jgi:hypothetical protein